MRATTILVAVIFAVNLVLQRPVVESLLFSLALAVGLTPELLPAIVSVSLAAGARQMARQQVIVKRLDAIEDFGAMTVLCTDKPGTLTSGAVSLAAALDPRGNPSERVARLAWLNARYQTSYTNPLDQAILHSGSFETAGIELLGEAPYDFGRKRLSVLVRDGDGSQLITKGAFASVLSGCTRVAWPDEPVALEPHRAELETLFARLSGEGFRVLGIADRTLSGTACRVDDEREMTFTDFLALADPAKPGAAAAIAALANLGITVRMITGDNPLAAAHAGAAAGLDPASLLTGNDLAALDDRELARVARETAVFADIEPAQKMRLVRALRATGQVVGFLGDGINDAPALHAADDGISVDTAADVAKQAAAIVLQIFAASPELFRSSWFVVSVMTELAVMLVLRTRKPFFRSRPGRALLLSSSLVAVVTLALPFSPLAPLLGFVGLPAPVLLAVAAIASGYVFATEMAKKSLSAQA